ncbi:MAG: tetratricopeptide repeat protein [Bacteroidetes bacterium]|nr:tetratricopeptide repeat protein [Bacteroidota bacterium]
MSVNLCAQTDPVLSQPVDSILHVCARFYQTDPARTLGYAEHALQKALRNNDDLQIGQSYEYMGVSHDFLGEFDSALVYFEKAEPYLKKTETQVQYANLLRSRANSLYSLSRYKESLQDYLAALEIIRKTDRKRDEASLLMGVGNVYSSMDLKQEALNYYNKSLDLFLSVRDSVTVSYLYTNIAEVFSALGRENEMIEYHRKALLLKEHMHDDYGLVYSYKNMSEIMVKLNRRDSALYFAYRAVAISQKIDNTDFLCESYQGLANVYDLYNNLDSANTYYNKALYLAIQMKTLRNQHAALLSLAKVLQKKGEYKLALERLFDYVAVHDSLYNLDMQRSLHELQTQYETDKKEKEIVLLNERDKKRKWIIYSGIGGLILLGMLSFSLFNRYRLKRRSATELEARNAVIQHQKEVVEEKNKEITDSINYARRIQQALLTGDSYFTANLGAEHFIFHKPKDIVSGDFYWGLQHHDMFYIATADCTGHGVPGAFMSMLNISYLNEAVIERNIREPDQVLHAIRKEVIKALNPHGTTIESKDGMDCVLCAFNLQEMHLSFAAANNPLWLCRNNFMVEYKPDKMPVGKHDKEHEPFTCHHVELQKGDVIYTFTDGYADQFGGEKGKKFKYQQLEALLLSIHQLPVHEQAIVLEKRFHEWKGNLEQVDDVLVIGVKII